MAGSQKLSDGGVMKLNELMQGYLSEGQPRVDPLESIIPPNILHENIELPVQPLESKREIKEGPERLARTFSFDNLASRNWFVSEILENEKSNKHYAKILISGLEVKIEINTHDLNRVTELDQEYASYCDEVMGDIDFISGGPDVKY